MLRVVDDDGEVLGEFSEEESLGIYYFLEDNTNMHSSMEHPDIVNLMDAVRRYAFRA